MRQNFVSLELSIFDGCSFPSFVDIIKEIYDRELKQERGCIYSQKVDLDKYLTPTYGEYPKFTCWNNYKYPNKIFLISSDDKSSLAHVIHKKAGGNHIRILLTDIRMQFPAFHFHYSDSYFVERDILAYKEDKWVFYEKGTPLQIENTSYYKKRLVKNRLNSNIIEEYLIKLGICLWDIDSSIDNIITYEQNSW